MKNLWKILLSVSLLLLWVSTAFAGKIWLEPSWWQFISECPFEVSVMVDTEWVESNTMGVSFYIDDTIFALNELNTVWAIFPAYTSFVRGTAWHGDKKWAQTISVMGTTAQKAWFIWKWKFATLRILPLLWAKSLDIQFYAIPGFSADDSNINYASWDTIFDALTEAVGGTYTFVGGDCPAYEAPVSIPEGVPVVLKTQEKKTFFLHQMPFFPRMAKLFVNNINYIIILLLAVVILFVLFRKKKDNKAINDNKTTK